MTRVEFHYNAAEPIRLAAKTITSLVQSGRKVLVYVPDDAWYQAIDRMLWTHAQLSFTPHCAQGADIAPETPVWLATQAEGAEEMDDVLVNLSESVPSFFSRFSTAIEFVGITEDEKISGRARYKFYQDRGYILDRFDHETGT